MRITLWTVDDGDEWRLLSNHTQAALTGLGALRMRWAGVSPAASGGARLSSWVGATFRGEREGWPSDRLTGGLVSLGWWLTRLQE